MRAGRGRGREGPGPVGGPGGARGRGPGPGPVAPAPGPAKEAAAEGPITVTATALPATSFFGTDIKNEYDPVRPNDYEAFCKQREQQRKRVGGGEGAPIARHWRPEAEAEAERQERLREMRDLEALELQHEPAAAPAPPGIQPPQPMAASEDQRRAALSISGEEAFARRGMAFQPAGGPAPGGPGAPVPAGGADDGGWLGMGPGGLGMGSVGGGLGLGGGDGVGSGAPGAPAAPPPSAGPKGMTLAQKMLEKMGWREGEGLGRNRQGIAAPLVLQKTDVRSGVIVSAAPAVPAAAQQLPDAGPPPGEAGAPPPSPADIQAQIQQAAALAAARAGLAQTGAPTRVLLLRNMVGPGEVDEKLDEEVGIECNKYGTVTDVVIFETKPLPPGFPDAQAVRIFVQFERVEGATKALVALQGRFFGGRQLHASFFDESRYERSDLAPRPEELS
eukprot:scaffold21.g2204.t1